MSSGLAPPLRCDSVFARNVARVVVQTQHRAVALRRSEPLLPGSHDQNIIVCMLKRYTRARIVAIRDLPFAELGLA